MSVLTLNVDEVMRTLSTKSSNPFVVHDKEVDIIRFAINSGFADIVLDGQVALRVMYQRPGETEVRAQTLTYYDTDGLHNYYDWQLSQSDLAKNGSLMVALCILDISGGEVSEWHTTPCAVRVLSTIHTDDSDEGDDTITPTVKERVAVLETMIQRVASGAPIVVASASAMTDTEQIYVLSTDGNWYYHNGTAWVAGGTYGAVATDSTLTQSGIPADAEVVGDKITKLETDLEDAIDGNQDLISDATIYNVLIGSSTNKWNASAGNRSYFAEVPENVKEIIITAQDNQAAIYALLTTDNHQNGATPDYATGSKRTSVPAGETKIVSVPDDCKYITVMKTASSIDYTPSLVAYRNTIGTIIGNVDDIYEKIEFSQNTNNLWAIGNISHGYALVPNSAALSVNDAYDTSDYIPVNDIKVIYGTGLRYWFYDSEKVTISGSTGILNNNPLLYANGDHYVEVPEGAAYFRICVAKASKKKLYAPTGYEDYLDNLIKNGTGESRKLYCLGDSITRGMYAEYGASSSSGPTSQGYPYWIGKMTGYEVTNLGNSGSGWANIGSAETAGDPSTARNAKDIVDYYDFADADIITMAWGVNDWKGASQNVVLGDMSSESGDGTVIGNMKYCIETLVVKKPTAQLIVLLPLNTNRQWSGMSTMTEADNWAFGYAYRNNQTLADYRNAIRACAEYYNVKVIDLEEICPINRLNLRYMCGDGLHPTKAFHKQMGLALANLIA